jgi:putative membrane protein
MFTISNANSTSKKPFTKNKFLKLLVILFSCYWTYCWFYNQNMENYIIENLLVIIFIPIIIYSYFKIKLSDTSYLFLFIYLMLHVYGSYYAYTDAAIGEWLKNTFHLWRNPYDRIVHFSFGFFISYIAFDILKNNFNKSLQSCYIYPIEIMFSLGTIFEMIEWAVAVNASPLTGETYVATQGDVWDAHKDIALAFLGASIMMGLHYLLTEIKK